MMKYFLMTLGLICLIAAPVQAEITPPDRDSLRSFWEETQKNNEHIVVFDKTDTEHVYTFETTFFPYKGRLKVLNILVSKPPHTMEKGIFSGLIETELLDAPNDFFTKHAHSYYAWQRLNHFYFDGKAGQWFLQDDWSDYFAESAPPSRPSFYSYIDELILIGGLILFIVILLRLTKKQRQMATHAQETMMTRQKQALDIVTETLVVTKEQLDVLKKIRDKLP